jgi:hypothetical protein
MKGARHNRQLAENRPKKDDTTDLDSCNTQNTRFRLETNDTSDTSWRRRFLRSNLNVRNVGGRRRVRNKKRPRNVLQGNEHGPEAAQPGE